MAIDVHNTAPAPRVDEAVLFPFDDHSLPFSAGLRLQLVPGKGPGMQTPVVVPKGPAGAPDDARVRFYGTVLPMGDALHMWYLGGSSADGGRTLRPCYATSGDGIHWEKPALGLVEHGGSRANNLVEFGGSGAGGGGDLSLAALPIIYDPDESRPDRRYKTAFESGRYGNCLAVAWSPDGLRWTIPDINPVAPMLEQTGLIRFHGCYYVNGQGGRHFGAGRKLVTFASYDFEHWTHATALGLRRDRLPPHSMESEWNAGEEVHLGAGLWDRGNVILGVYDVWHGEPTGDRSLVKMDLGFVVSHDALHYREPIPDFKLIPAREEADAPVGRGPSVSHGQGLLNWGERTLLWYELWGLGDIRLASWPRDRLGYFQKYDYPGRPAWLPPGASYFDVTPHCISCPLHVEPASGRGARVALNVDGLGPHSEVLVEVLDEQFRPVPGASGPACVPVRENRLRQPVTWRGRDTIPVTDAPFRLQITMAGVRPEDAKLYAIYVS